MHDERLTSRIAKEITESGLQGRGKIQILSIYKDCSFGLYYSLHLCRYLSYVPPFCYYWQPPFYIGLIKGPKDLTFGKLKQSKYKECVQRPN